MFDPFEHLLQPHGKAVPSARLYPDGLLQGAGIIQMVRIKPRVNLIEISNF